MSFTLPRRSLARPGDLPSVRTLSILLPAAAVSAILLFPIPSFAAHKHAARHHQPIVSRLPTHLSAAPISVPFTANVASVQTLLVRSHLPPMGQNNAVRLWVRGDASGATLRVRVLAPVPVNTPDGLLPRAAWISAPIPITFGGWREFVLPQSKFTLRAVDPSAAATNPALPADAQTTSPEPAAAPTWEQANGLALDVTASRPSTLVVDDIAWATLDGNGNGTASTTVEDFETGNVAAWQKAGTSQQIAAVSTGVATLPILVHGGHVAFSVTITPPGVRRLARLRAVIQRMTDAGTSTLVYTPGSLFEPILPDSLPPAVGASSEITMEACAEQTQAASFCLYSPTALTDVAVSLNEDLQGIGHILPRSVVDVRVVKVRPVGGSGPLRDPDTAGLMPGLLVKDDRVPLAGLDTPMRLTGPAVADIPADTTKQFWVTVTVPRNTPAGSYTGSLAVVGRGVAPFRVRMTLDVLPLRLLSSAKQYGIDLRSRLDPAPDMLPSPDGRQLVTDFVSKDMLDTQLADIALHGFSIATLYDSPTTLADAENEYRLYGFGTPYNLYKGNGDPNAVETDRKSHNYPALTYYTDPNPVTDARARMDLLTKNNLPLATYITSQSDYNALQADMSVALYNSDSDYAQQLLRTHGQRVSMLRDWWYWQATTADPRINRLDSGYLLWKANLYGAFLPDYQTAFGADPYDESSAGAVPSKSQFRPLMLAYPIKGGVLDTLQWEACREGITDTRYLTTMFAALRECKDAHIAKPLVTEAESYVKMFLDKPLTSLTDRDYDAARDQISDYAMQLRTTVDGYNKAHNIQ